MFVHFLRVRQNPKEGKGGIIQPSTSDWFMWILFVPEDPPDLPGSDESHSSLRRLVVLGRPWTTSIGLAYLHPWLNKFFRGRTEPYYSIYGRNSGRIGPGRFCKNGTFPERGGTGPAWDLRMPDKIGPCQEKCDRDHDRDWNFDPDQSDFDFHFSSKPWLKIFKRPLIENRLLSMCYRRNTRIVAAGDQLNFLQPYLAQFFFSRLWLKIFKQGLICKIKRDHDRDWKCEPDRSRFDWMGSCGCGAGRIWADTFTINEIAIYSVGWILNASP